MANMATKNLPTLRADLELTVAPNEEGGRPVWMLHDPLHASFTRIDWIQFEIIKRLDEPQSFERLVARITEETTIREDEDEIREFIGDLIRSDLTTLTLHKPSANLKAEQAARKQGVFKWIIFHYLYFRLPIIHPDKFLENSLGFFKVLSSKVFMLIYIAVSILGLFFLSQRFGEYIHTFTNFLNPRGIIIYGISIATLKLIHEFSHAYTAKYYGNRVATMGLAFIVMWPIPYCDVTDSWRMSSRSKRLRISAAGVIAELVVAAFALFLWGVTDNTHLKSIAFVLSSLSLLGTLLVNLNPLMRFDGYYIFSDLAGIDNLQSRAFAMTRWFYRSVLLGLDLPRPEPHLSLKRTIFMLIYSICTWIYRLFLYTGIAVVVYYTFPKAIGIFMFALEIFIFLIRPLYNELTTGYKLVSGKRISLRFAVFAILLFCILAWVALPFCRYSSIPAITTTEEMQVIYAPFSGIITSQAITRGTKVDQGEELLVVSSKDLNGEIELAELNVEQLASDLKKISSQSDLRGFAPQMRETYLQSKAKLRALKNMTKQSIIYSDFSGTVTDYKETLKDGVAVYKGEELGKIYNLADISIFAYASAMEAQNLRIGDKLEFIPNYSNYRDYRYQLQITKIHRTREEILTNPELSSTQGGSINVTPDKDGNLLILKAYYKIECAIISKDCHLRFDQPGRVTYWSRPRSYLKSFIEHIYQVLIRESGI